MLTELTSKTGLYIHIPFCSFCCHYCDFAKTANWDASKVDDYFSLLQNDIKLFIKTNKTEENPIQFSSIFFGGGTPGLFTKELGAILDLVRPLLVENCEISLEANPHNISKDSLNYWKSVGFNRLSIGVQTFQDAGLSFLKRDHDANLSRKSVELATSLFENVSIDLIYGWQGQTMEQWQKDLDIALTYDLKHISLYNLIYESKTPIGRAKNRGAVMEQSDELEESYYKYAMSFLDKKKFMHDEVSNWAKEGYSCLHNWLYWQGGSYVAFGQGAHGFLNEVGPLGLRYYFPSSFVRFKNMDHNLSDFWSLLNKNDSVEQRENPMIWLMEYVGSSLRCKLGVDLKYIERKSGYVLAEDCLESLPNDIFSLMESHLTLSEKEWFRETYWVSRLLDLFKTN